MQCSDEVGMRRNIWLIFAFGIAATSSAFDDSCQSSTADCDDDPRLNYDVDFDDFPIPDDVDEAAVLEEMANGENGFFVIKNLFSAQDIRHARELVLYLVAKDAKSNRTDPKTSHAGKKALLPVRRNVLEKGPIFHKLAQHPILVSMAAKTMGSDFQLGTYAANTVLPGGRGQEPHLDYPYWDYFRRDVWPIPPKHPDIPFFLNMQVTLLLDDFTVENGATAVRPGSQRLPQYPWDRKDFEDNSIRVTGSAGDAIVFHGLLHHGAMPNLSPKPRSAIILQYLPKWVRPMEDLPRSLSPQTIASLDPTMRKMLLLDYEYPVILDKE